MTGSPLRKDAARNHQQIVDTGRRLVDGGETLRLNEVARAAGIGVATVYRHFPTAEALLETVARPRLDDLLAYAEEALDDPDPWTALEGFIVDGIEIQQTDASVQPVFAAADHALPETTELLTRLHRTIGQLLDRARAAGVIRLGLTQDDLTRLMCGVVFAGGVHASPAERPELTRRYLGIVLDGIRTPFGDLSV